MNHLVLLLLSTMLVRLGATLISDLGALFLKHVFQIDTSNMCLVGRWLRYMPEGTFKHRNIRTTPQKSAECIVGWIAHYLIGILFALMFIAFVGSRWLQHPTLIPAILFGIVIVAAPFLIMQPSFGLGFAASMMANPAEARLRTLMNHVAFGVGLYLFGLLVSSLP